MYHISFIPLAGEKWTGEEISIFLKSHSPSFLHRTLRDFIFEIVLRALKTISSRLTDFCNLKVAPLRQTFPDASPRLWFALDLLLHPFVRDPSKKTRKPLFPLSSSFSKPKNLVWKDKSPLLLPVYLGKLGHCFFLADYGMEWALYHFRSLAAGYY